MFVLKKKPGNAFKHTESETKRDRLLADGWEEVTTDPEPKKKKDDKKPKKNQEPKKGDVKGADQEGK